MGTGPFEQFQHLAQSVKGGVISDCGHWIMEEQSAKLLENLTQFLRQ